MENFVLPQKIYYGKGSLDRLGSFGGGKVFVITGQNAMENFGFAERAEEILQESGAEIRFFNKISPEPSLQIIREGVEAANAFDPDLIIALGGGSVIGAAKLIRTLYEDPDLELLEDLEPFSLPERECGIKLIAVPSTFSTGAEASPFAALREGEKKYILADYGFVPDVVILEPELVETVPQRLAGESGVALLAMATEAYVSSRHSVFTDPYALRAIQEGVRNFPGSYDGCEINREKIQYAAFLAGLANSGAMAGLCASIASHVSALYSVSQHKASAICLPYVMLYNSPYAAGRYADIARSLNLQGFSAEDLLEAYCTKTDDFNDMVGIPDSFLLCGVDEDDFMARKDLLVSRIMGDFMAASNPRPLNREDIENLLDYIFYGRRIDF